MAAMMATGISVTATVPFHENNDDDDDENDDDERKQSTATRDLPSEPAVRPVPLSYDGLPVGAGVVHTTVVVQTHVVVLGKSKYTCATLVFVGGGGGALKAEGPK